jgi:hypothetical protein
MKDLDMEFITEPEFISNSTFSVEQASVLLDTTNTFYFAECSLVNATHVAT